MSGMTARQLITLAAACRACGREHVPWQETPPPMAPTWKDRKDGHAYQATIPNGVVSKLRILAGETTGT